LINHVNPSQKPLFEKSGWAPPAQKLLLYLSRDFRTSVAQIKKSLFASFSTEKEVLTSLLHAD
jgi:hypothetical protein